MVVNKQNTPNTYIPKIVGYVRVSTEYQKDGESIAMQKKRIAEYAEFMNMEIENIYEDIAITGKTTKRPGLISALEKLNKGDILAVYSISRFSRNLKDSVNMMDDLDNKGIKLVSVSENFDMSTPNGRAVFAMLSVMAQLESDITSERVKEGMIKKKNNGEHYSGSPPFGYKLKGKKGEGLEKHPEEYPVLKYMLKEFRIGHLCYSDIANILNHYGCKTRDGKEWNKQKIGYQVRSYVKRQDRFFVKGRGEGTPEDVEKAKMRKNKYEGIKGKIKTKCPVDCKEDHLPKL